MTDTTTTGRKLVAWATTHVSMPEADPGIVVLEQDEQDAATREVATSDAQLPYWAVAEDDGLVEADADELLATLGHRRTGPWQDSGGQWAAEVEPAA